MATTNRTRKGEKRRCWVGGEAGKEADSEGKQWFGAH